MLQIFKFGKFAVFLKMVRNYKYIRKEDNDFDELITKQGISN